MHRLLPGRLWIGNHQASQRRSEQPGIVAICLIDFTPYCLFYHIIADPRVKLTAVPVGSVQVFHRYTYRAPHLE